MGEEGFDEALDETRDRIDQIEGEVHRRDTAGVGTEKLIVQVSTDKAN